MNSLNYLANANLKLDDALNERSRRRLLNFTTRSFPEYLPGWCHELICNKLDQFLADVIAKKSPRLMIFAPPRSGKSELVSRRLPAFAFGKYPDLSIIAACYSADLSSRMNRDVQRIIDNDQYVSIFPATKLSGMNIKTSSSGNRLRTSDIFEIVDRSGSYRSTGVGGGITGMGADILIIDDPIKDFKEARSKVVRDSVWEWYASTAYTRLSPGGGVLIILTRWNEDDLAGRIIKQSESGDGDKFEIITLKAIAEEDEIPYRKRGEALHPERYPLERLREIEKVLGSYLWSALYQQSPAPGEGNIFNPDMMPIMEAIPAGTRLCRAWDFAALENDGDYTVGLQIGKMPDGRFIITDVIRSQWRPEQVEAALKNTADRDGMKCKIRIPQDPGQAGKAQAINFTRLLAGYIVKSLPVTGDKVLRAMPVAAQCNVGNVVLLKAPWNDELISEMRVFPNGANDDQIDALSDAFSEFIATGSGVLDFYKQEAAKKEAAKIPDKKVA